MFAASKSGRAVSAAATDPYFPYVPLLLETTSTNGQQNNTFLDSGTANGGVGFTITRNGTPTQGSVTPYWPNGYWSNNFPSAVNSYLTIAYNAAFNIASSTPFTIEFWFNTTGFGGVTNAFISGYNGAPSGWTVSFLGASNVFSFGLGDTTILTSSSQTISVGVWYHFALVRNASNSISMYLNGTSIATPVTNSGAIGATSQGPWIGGTPGVGQYYHGYISNLRVVNGTAIVPPAGGPTSPLTAVTNTALLTCQSNRFRDNSANTFTLTPVSTPTVQAFQPFSPAASYTSAAYGGSGYFNGSSDLITTPNATALQLNGTSWTVECYVYLTASTAAYRTIISKRGGGTAEYELGIDPSGFFYYYTTAVLASTFSVPLNAWTHLAVTCDGTNTYMFANGALVKTNTGTAAASGTAALNMGNGYVGNNQWFPGYTSNARIIKGQALSTTTFTPPTAPVTASTVGWNGSSAALSGTVSFLANFTNAGIYDAAAQNNAITVGDAQVSTTITAKWPPTSMKFDGTGDWLTAIDGPQLQLGTGDFTIDGWLYLSANGMVYGIISKGAAATGWSVNVTALNKLQFSYTASNLTGTTSLAASAWYYFAVVRSGSATGNLKVYLNGSVEATSGGAVTDNFNQTNILYVGADRIGATPLNGYLQDVRITKGVARTITTPTAAFPTR